MVSSVCARRPSDNDHVGHETQAGSWGTRSVRGHAGPKPCSNMRENASPGSCEPRSTLRSGSEARSTIASDRNAKRAMVVGIASRIGKVQWNSRIAGFVRSDSSPAVSSSALMRSRRRSAFACEQGSFSAPSMPRMTARPMVVDARQVMSTRVLESGSAVTLTVQSETVPATVARHHQRLSL